MSVRHHPKPLKGEQTALDLQVFFDGGQFEQRFATGRPRFDQLADDRHLGVAISGLEAGDHIDDIFRGGGINSNFELVEDFLGAAGNLDIFTFEGGGEVGLGNVAGFPQFLGGRLARIEIVVA